MIVKIVAVIVLFLGITASYYLMFMNIVFPKFDLVSQVSLVVDGDTFDIASGDRIRLADVNAPEQGEIGYEQAGEILEQLVYGETVYLDVDDIYRWDVTGERLVCVAYVSHNSTHYINVNKELLFMDYAVVWDQDNEFNPTTWSRYVSKISPESRRNLLMLSTATGILSTVFIVFVLRRGYLTGKRMVDRVRGWIKRLVDKV